MCYRGSLATVEWIFLITARCRECVVVRKVRGNITDDVNELYAKFSHPSTKFEDYRENGEAILENTADDLAEEITGVGSSQFEILHQ